jgi:hypothetical protein
VGDIIEAIPHGSVLTLCFADPFDIGLRFETIRALASTRRVDFLVTLALGMDANRNYELYVREDAVKIDEFLGSADWRPRWATAQWDAVKFSRFLADEFTQKHGSLGIYPAAVLHNERGQVARKEFTALPSRTLFATRTSI